MMRIWGLAKALLTIGLHYITVSLWVFTFEQPKVNVRLQVNLLQQRYLFDYRAAVVFR